MAAIAFVKPALEVDAIWDSVRTTMYLGIWYLASLLKQLGHEVHYLDETVRNNGLDKRVLFGRTVSGREIRETLMTLSPRTLHQEKMADFRSLTPEAFVKKYSAFQGEGDRVERIMMRIGNAEEATLAMLDEIRPDIVGIPLIATANYLPATRLAARIKERLPKTKIVFGGQHVSALPHEFLKRNAFVDHLVIGDAINAFPGIADNSITDRLIDGGVADLADFPQLDVGLVENSGYPVVPTYAHDTDGRRSVDFMFTRGCYRNCEFCVAGSKRSRVSASAYGDLSQQLAHFKAYGIEELIIEDDAFLWDRAHVESHLSEIFAIMKDHGMFWQNQGGVEFESLTDSVTQKIIDYNSHGIGRCTCLYVPFNPRGWNKRQSAVRSITGSFRHLHNLKRLREAGIYVCSSAIIGTPDQTPESFAEELAANRALIEGGFIDAALPLCATMLPGTRWHDMNGHNIVNKEDYAGYSLFTAHHRTVHFRPHEVEMMMVEWNQRLADVQRTLPWFSAFAD